MNSVRCLIILAVATLPGACAPAPSQHSSPGVAHVDGANQSAVPASTRDSHSTADRREETKQTVVQADLEGKQFRSTELGEGGLGPDGVVMGHWYLTFRSGSVFWDHSDVREGAGYELDAEGSITSYIGNPPDRPLRAHYDKATDRLFWGGTWYERVAPDNPRADNNAVKPSGGSGGN